MLLFIFSKSLTSTVIMGSLINFLLFTFAFTIPEFYHFLGYGMWELILFT